MEQNKLQVFYLDEALAFLRNLPIKVLEKIGFNISKIERGILDNELFKKIGDTSIWEVRTVFNGNCYRLFAFWDTDSETLIIATHGIIKKTQKTPSKEIKKAEEIRKRYFKLKNNEIWQK